MAIIFLEWEQLLEIHRQQLEAYGGAEGFIDKGTVEAAFNRARNKYHYGAEEDIAVLAAAYFCGLCTTQGFSDGNKRTALNAAILFLRLNGLDLDADLDELYDVAIMVARNSMNEEAFADWLRMHIVELP